MHDISAIATLDRNNGLARNGERIHFSPKEEKHLLKILAGNLAIIGKNTFDEYRRYSKFGIRFIIVSESATKDPAYNRKYDTFKTLKEALAYAYHNYDSKEIVICGGERLYKEAFKYVNKLYITHLDITDNHADRHFPLIEAKGWCVRNVGEWKADGNVRSNRVIYNRRYNVNPRGDLGNVGITNKRVSRKRSFAKLIQDLKDEKPNISIEDAFKKSNK